MENILLMVEGRKTTQVTSLDYIMQEFLAKSSVWDFHEITKDEYRNKSDEEKKNLILIFFNQMVIDTILSFVSLLFGVSVLILSVQEHINRCSCI